MPEYTAAALVACAAVLGLERFVLRTGLLRRLEYWLTIVIVLSFQVVVDGWLTKLSAPIVVYNRAATTGFRPVWDIPVEDFVFGFAMVTLVVLLWQRCAQA
jgi:lycopene cyclase domain-containing protein